MTASSYDGRKPEPPYHTDSDIVVDLQGQIDELTAERDHLRAELQRLKSAASEGVESLIHNVAMAAWDAGCDSGVVWCPDADMSKRGIVPMSQEEGLRNAREHFAKHGSGSPVGDYESALNALRACLRSSPAPVVGGVPELTDGEVRDAWYAVEQDPEQVGDAYQDGVRYGYALAASRLSSIKPGEEVVNSEEYAALLDFAERIVPIRDNLFGISWVGNLKDVFAAYDNWYAIRIAQGTSTEKETKNV